MPLKEEPFYRQHLFSWVLLFIMPPLGILVIWGFKHHPLFFRIVLTLVFLTQLKANPFMGLILFGFLLFQLLSNHYHFFFKAPDTGENGPLDDNLEAIAIPMLNGFDRTAYVRLFSHLFIHQGYEVLETKEGSAFDISLSKGRKTWGIKLFLDQSIERRDVLKTASEAKEEKLQKAILYTNQRMTLYAIETKETLDWVELWDEATFKHCLMQSRLGESELAHLLKQT